ncbi:MAG TPA: hypothetical protein VF719_01240 [Abditibacteriaceae bacterium]
MGLLYNPDDQNVHFAWAKQAQAGHFFIRDLFTHESLTAPRPLFVNLFTWGMGTVSALTGLSLVAVYHVLRLIFSVAALFCFRALCRAVTPDGRVRTIAVALAAFGAGAGWLQPWLPSHSFIDRPDTSFAMMTEAFMFTSALLLPLHIASFACLAFIYRQVLVGESTQCWKPVWSAGLVAFLLTNIHTYDTIPLNVTLLLWSLKNSPLSTRALARLKGRHAEGSPAETKPFVAWAPPIFIVICTLPPLIYQYFVFRNSAEFRLKALTPTLPPSLLDLALSFSVWIPVCLLGLWMTRRDARVQLIGLWLVVMVACLYLPLSFARKMSEGIILPVALLAALGIVFLFSQLKTRARRIVFLGLSLGLMSLSTLQFVSWCLWNASDNNDSRRHHFMPPLYLPEADAAALDYLRVSKIERKRAVLCLPFAGNYIPRETGRTVFIGHWAETLHGKRKLIETLRFFEGKMGEQEALTWLRHNNIGLVLRGSYENRAAASARTTMYNRLLPVYSQAGTRLDRVPYPPQ